MKKLYENVVTLRVRIKCPSESKKDDFLSRKLCEDTGADPTALRVRKDLYKIREITRWRDKARKLVRDDCIPWSAVRTDSFGNKKEDALWACAGRVIERVAGELQKYREEFFTEVKKKVNNYDEVIEGAKSRLGSAFNADDFPTKEEFEQRFGWDVEVQPLQEMADIEEDFRTKLPKAMADEQVAKAKAKLEGQMANGVQSVMSRALDKLMDEDDGIIPKLRAYDPDPKDKRAGNTFRDKSLYENMDDLQEWAEGINDFLDADELRDLVASIDTFRKDIRPQDPNLVRVDKATRERVIAGLADIVETAKGTPGAAKGGGFGQFV